MLDYNGINGEYITYVESPGLKSFLCPQYNFNLIIAKILGVGIWSFPYEYRLYEWNKITNTNLTECRKKMNNQYRNIPQLQFGIDDIL
jgi:hypothetical protein